MEFRQNLENWDDTRGEKRCVRNFIKTVISGAYNRFPNNQLYVHLSSTKGWVTRRVHTPYSTLVSYASMIYVVSGACSSSY